MYVILVGEDRRFCYICLYFFPLLLWESLFIFFPLQGVLLQMTADLAQAMDIVQKVDYDVCQALDNNAIHVSLIKRLIELPTSWYTAIPALVNHVFSVSLLKWLLHKSVWPQGKIKLLVCSGAGKFCTE